MRWKSIMSVILCVLSVTVLRAQEYGPDNLPPFVHPPILEPVPDGIQLDVPHELGNQDLASLGFVDVTDAPFYADPTGRQDSTAALQDAINFARDAQLVCFFPQGVYSVSDTLLLRHGIHMRSHRATFINNRHMPCVLIGSRRGEDEPDSSRPRIVLRRDSPGFDDPGRLKYVIEHQQYVVERFEIEINELGGGPSLMNTMLVNLDIEIGPGNPGAAGVHMRSCEGSAIQDVTIDATNGYAGIVGATGNGGSWTNVKVVGGRIGLDMRGWTPPTPTMEGVTLLDQTEAAIVYGCRGPLTAVGVAIRSSVRGPVIRGEAPWGAFDGGLNLIDSRIEINAPVDSEHPTAAISAERSVYLSNTYVKGADTIVNDSLQGDPKDWIHIKEYASGSVPSQKGYQLSAPVYIDGERMSTFQRLGDAGVAPPEDLQSRHVWGADFPSWETNGAANVKDAPYSAKGDSYTDDTDSLQRAIDENEIVFLPKGYYRITKTLRLRPNTKLIGVAQHLSVIMVRDPKNWFGDSNDPKPLIETADDPEAETVIAMLGIRFPLEVENSFPGETLPLYALKWSAGRNSIFRSNDVHPLRLYGFKGSKDHEKRPMGIPSILINGNGGGRWYNYHTGQFFTPTTQEQRALLIDKTSEPLYFYNFEPQGGRGRAVAEIKGSRFVSLFGCKTECDTTFLHVVDSDHIRVFGHGGIGNAAPGGSIYIFERTPNYLLTSLADQANLNPDIPYYSGNSINRNIETYFPLRDESTSNEAITVPSLERPVLFRMGEPVDPYISP